MNTDDPGLGSTSLLRLRDGKATVVNDTLAVEEPLEIRLGYTDPRKGRVHRSISITMRTPGDDAALALGFLHAESILRSTADLAGIDNSRPNLVRIELHDSAAFDPLRLERHFYTTSSCGVCGKASLEALNTSGFDVLQDESFRIEAAVLYRLPTRLREKQPLFRRTGGNHGVALFDASGNILRVAEDVGRHNAMDKLSGHLLLEQRLPLREHGILLSGRASFELLQKALANGCQLVAAVGAPSTLAVELAQEFNITLVGFLGETGCNIYHGAARILY
jgi:FdhD protein